MLKRSILLNAMAVLLLSAFMACSSGEKPAAPREEATAPAAAPAAATEVPAGKGNVEVTVNFTGTPPKMPKIKKGTDPTCNAAESYSQEVVVNQNGTLNGSVVQMVGVPGTYAPPAEQVVLDQQGCMYVPHVATAQFNQEVAIRNSDPVLHNVHVFEGKQTIMNQGHPPKGKDIVKTFSNGAHVKKFVCDIHPWMTGWLVMSPDPFHGVTGDDGKVILKDAPVGTYKIEVWQEKYGTKTVDVTVQANQTTAVTVAYDGTEATGG